MAKPKKATVFTKNQLLATKRYARRRDLLGALLADDRSYTIEEVDATVKNFLKGKVK